MVKGITFLAIESIIGRNNLSTVPVMFGISFYILCSFSLRLQSILFQAAWMTLRLKNSHQFSLFQSNSKTSKKSITVQPIVPRQQTDNLPFPAFIFFTIFFFVVWNASFIYFLVFFTYFLITFVVICLKTFSRINNKSIILFGIEYNYITKTCYSQSIFSIYFIVTFNFFID